MYLKKRWLGRLWLVRCEWLKESIKTGKSRGWSLPEARALARVPLPTSLVAVVLPPLGDRSPPVSIPFNHSLSRINSKIIIVSSGQISETRPILCKILHSLPVLFRVRSISKLLELQTKTDLLSSQCLPRRLRELLVLAEVARHVRVTFKVRKGLSSWVKTLANGDSSWRPRSSPRKASLPSWHCRPSRNPTLSEQRQAPPPKATLCAPGEWHSCLQLAPLRLTPSPLGSRNRLDRTTTRRGHALAEPGHHGSPRSCRGLHGASLRGHQPMRHPREAGDHYAEGHSVGETDTRYLGRPGLRRDEN